MKLAQMRHPLDERINFGHLDVLNSPATHAKYMVVRLDMAIVTCAAMKRGDLARLAHLAKLLENPMDGGQRYVRMFAAHRSIDFFGAWMVLRSDQRLDDGQALRRDR